MGLKMTNGNKRGLGRGLSALMADVRGEGDEAPAARSAERRVPIEQLRPNRNQPRRHFDQAELEELAASIRELGIIQPLVVREAGDGYEIVAGERRWRAAQMAQLHDVPVVIRSYDDHEVLQIAIVENVQRANLNPIDEAHAYQMLMEQYGQSQEQVADAVGKSRSHVANLVRLLQLPPRIRTMLTEGSLTAGHARALIGAEGAEELADRIVRRGMSVRDVESLVRGHKPATARSRPAQGGKDADTLALEGDLSASLGLPVDIDHKPGTQGGTMAIRYSNFEDLDRLCQLLSGVRND